MPKLETRIASAIADMEDHNYAFYGNEDTDSIMTTIINTQLVVYFSPPRSSFCRFETAVSGKSEW